ncbi:MAG: transcriptional repressor [Clostridium sp.]|nr:transcriptional repressor [Clostridium sp.]
MSSSFKTTKNNCYKEALKGQRYSKNRNDVIECLENESFPLTIDEIYSNLKQKNDKLSLSTIYRITEKLSSLNIVKKSFMLDDNKARFELMKEKHHHYMICTKCKKMIPIDGCPVEKVEEDIARSTGFNITGHKFELYGECSDCIKKEH